MSSEFKFTKCLEWCTKLPEENYPIKSPAFLLQGSEYFFNFELENEDGGDKWCYTLHMEVKSWRSKMKECIGDMMVKFKKNKEVLDVTTFIVSRQECGSEDVFIWIWSIDRDELRSKQPADYEDGNWIKFQLCSEDVDWKATEDKCIQTGSYMNTNVTVESLSEDMFKLLDKDVDYDAKIKYGDKEDDCIKVHKCILRTRSQVFKAMFESNMSEGLNGTVEIRDIDETHLRDFVRYLYTGVIPELTYEKAKILYEAGDKYDVKSLMLRCSDYLKGNLTSENALDCMAFAEAHTDEKLKYSATVYTLENKLYLRDKLWSPFCENYPNVALETYRALHQDEAENS